MEIDKKKGIYEMIEEMYSKHKEEQPEKKKKPFKLGWGKTLGAEGKIKQNKILVFRVSTNGNLRVDWYKIEDNAIYLKDKNTYHAVLPQHVLHYGKYPSIILHEDTLVPYCPNKEIEEALKNNLMAIGEKIIINEAKKAASELKKGFSFGGMWLWIGIIVIILIFLAYNLISKKSLF